MAANRWHCCVSPTPGHSQGKGSVPAAGLFHFVSFSHHQNASPALLGGGGLVCLCTACFLAGGERRHSEHIHCSHPCRFGSLNSSMAPSPPSLLQRPQYPVSDSPPNLQTRNQLCTDGVSLLSRPQGKASRSKRPQASFC